MTRVVHPGPLSPPVGSGLTAAFLTILACAFFAGANAFAKAAQVDGNIAPEQVVFFRFLFGFLVLSPWLVMARQPVFRTNAVHIHAMRVACGMGGIACLFAALGRLPHADVTAIAWSNPLVAMVIAALFLGDRVDARRWLLAALGFAGVLVMMRPTGAAIGRDGLLAIGAAVLIGAEVVLIRLLAQRDGPLTILAIANAGGCVAAAALAWPVMVWPAPAQWLLLAGTGVLMVIGQLMFMAALKARETSFVAPFYYATLIFALVYGVIFFGEIPDFYVYLGSAMILASGVTIAILGSRASLRAAGAVTGPER
ncbi:MAG TPA: DMT family transporter [Saliniramus sp.]|nr:DMT family transporter [Saliniramus sp.]